MSNDDNAPVRETLERTDVGYRLEISSTRGTGTRDQDRVTVRAETETLEELVSEAPEVYGVLRTRMEQARGYDPDAEREAADDE